MIEVLVAIRSRLARIRLEPAGIGIGDEHDAVGPAEDGTPGPDVDSWPGTE